MYSACEYTNCMLKMIQIRNVPDAVHRKLKAHAALEGMSLSEFLLAEVRRAAERPSLSELRRRIAQRTPVILETSPAQVLRNERDSR